jgi:lipopolysaccharide transport system ATP-binding protein
MGETLVQVDGLWKKYCKDLRRSLNYGMRDLGHEMFGQPVGCELRKKEFWALRDVSFELRRGECLGLIGANGAGKSTLLKVLSGLVKPTRGTVRVKGRMQALIELGAGFHQVLTGRENIFINAAVLGIPREYVTKKLDEIIDFAEIGDFIDAPVQTYSSGMRVRLGFAIALHMDPDIILIDEVLAVGDARFKRKARAAMDEMLARDMAVVFVSHNMHQMLGVADHVIWLDGGAIRMTGDTSAVSQEYLLDSTKTLNHEQPGRAPGEFRKLYPHKITGELELTQLQLQADGEPCARHIESTPRALKLRLQMNFKAKGVIAEAVHHGFLFRTALGESVAISMLDDHLDCDVGDDVERVFEMQLPTLHPGEYALDYIANQDGGMMFDGVEELLTLSISPYAGKSEPGGYHFQRMTLAARDGCGAVLLETTLQKGNSHGLGD